MLDNHTHRQRFMHLGDTLTMVTEEFFVTIAEYLDANMDYLDRFIGKNYYFYAKLEGDSIEFRVCQGFFHKSTVNLRIIKTI